MPLYSLKCENGHKFDRFIKLADLDQVQWCECEAIAHRQVTAPFVQSDLPAYISPITGEPVEGRKARREDLVRHGCVEFEPGMREQNDYRRRQADDKLESAVEETIESEISKMPARKRELLEQEVRAGAGLEYTRNSL